KDVVELLPNLFLGITVEVVCSNSRAGKRGNEFEIVRKKASCICHSPTRFDVTKPIRTLFLNATAVAGDLSQAMNEWFFKPNVNVVVKEEKTRESSSTTTIETTNSVDDLPPIVLVHGIFGFGKGRLGGLSYFAGAEKKDERVLVPDLGSLTSIYDRARELFYYLKGGQVDYGEEHSMAYGHSQFGRIYEQGHYAEWDEDHPIHFVGHSAGAQVVRVLQQMLADKAFKGYENTSDKWVLSITSLSGAFNGTTRTYLDGMQ
ncbi:unnamed protein product, partial [Dovyalis caffra]